MRALSKQGFLTGYMQSCSTLFRAKLSVATISFWNFAFLQMGVLYHNGLEVAFFSMDSSVEATNLRQGRRASLNFSDWYTAGGSPSSYLIGLVVQLVLRVVIFFLHFSPTSSSSNRYSKENRSLETSNCDVDDES